MSDRGAIILCGGQSSRMGMPKMLLPFGGETMLARITRLLAEVCDPIVVVAATGQALPELATPVIVARDRQQGRGPLEGLLAGLRALPDDVEMTFASGCDVPLLQTGFVRRMFELAAGHSAAVPECGGYLHPLASVYRTTLVDVVEALLATDRRRPSDVFATVDTRRVAEHELVDVDPRLDTLKNLNHPADYLAALAAAGFTAPAEVLARLRVE